MPARYALLALLAGCAYSETPCNPGPFFAGPSLENPRVAATADRFLVQWRWIAEDDTGPLEFHHRGVMIDRDGVVIDGTQFELEEGPRVYGLVSGPDRVLMLGELSPAGRFAELRDNNGQRIGNRIDTPQLGYGGALEGDSFLVPSAAGLVRVSMDGTIDAPIVLPGLASNLAVTATVTWVVMKMDETLTAVRVARGGGVLDATPHAISSTAYHSVVAARASEAVLVTESRERALAWHRLDPSGMISPAIPLVLDIEPHLRPRSLIPEASGYLLLLEHTGTSDITGVRITPDGIPSTPFTMFDHYTGNTLSIATHADRSAIVYGPIPREKGGPPRIEVVTVRAAEPQSEPLLIETVEGQTYTVDCGWF